MTDICTTPTRCPSILGKDNTGCGHRVLYGPQACWRRDGMDSPHHDLAMNPVEFKDYERGLV